MFIKSKYENSYFAGMDYGGVCKFENCKYFMWNFGTYEQCQVKGRRHLYNFDKHFEIVE